MMGDMNNLGSMMAAVMFVWAMFQQLFPDEFRRDVARYVNKFISYVSPYIEITFHEYQGDSRFERSKAFIAIERYLSENSSNKAKRLKANVIKDCESIVLSMDDYQEVTDEFKGVKIWWTSSKKIPKQQPFFSYRADEEKRYYKLTCKRKDREIITEFYLKHVLDEGKAIAVKTRQRKLYTNSKSDNGYSFKKKIWSHIIFEHPSTFDTLAMDPKKKKEILNDLITFSKSKDYYKKVGKSWKRGYLLYGPPGTGKSSMIAAMANFLEYDIYDLELTSVKDNTDLRKLLIDTTSKSIIVIEDIDCSLDLTGQRKEKKDESKDAEKDPIQKKAEEEKAKEKKGSEVTLSGLLNFIDGLWSACGSERLIVFTTNFVEKLDPALIRRGRMDKHIELSYCRFEAFKVLAKNYLDIESHDLFATIEQLLGETNMTPADVAENLMPKSSEENADVCLSNLIKSLEDTKEEARLKAIEDARIKAEEEASKKSEQKGENVQASDAKLANGEQKKVDEDGHKIQLSDAKENGVTVS
ncbi:AAA+ ATPase domain-containing protein [Artemisia annua]|uniref:AAA+ ATPase domain-containing protein n=1 Tax=Artemisia annua TaxID=35608 RepID=A0A2U1N3A3_ARTAN|nr:AAA+ ATPase domain-containing protein [Artemisia annua]